MRTSERSRVLIVGFDGATFDVIRPLTTQGRLPALARLMREGAWGVLRSTVPPISPIAWTTFSTGKNPGRHGVFDFRYLDHDYQRRARPMQQHGHKTLWQLLSDAGRRIIAVDVPFTYPPEAVNGLMISGYSTPRAPGTVFTFLPDLTQRLQEEGFDLTLGWPEAWIDVHPDFFRAWEEVMVERKRLLEHLFCHEDWDLFMVVFGITDTLAHTLWHFLEPAHPAFRDERAVEYREALFQGHEQADRTLEHLWSLMDERTHLIALSDHGFGTVRPRRWLFRFLVEHDWLRFQDGRGADAILSPLRKMALKVYTEQGCSILTSSRHKTLTTTVSGAAHATKHRLWSDFLPQAAPGDGGYEPKRTRTEQPCYTEIGWLRRLIRELRPGAKGKLRKALARGGMLAEAQNVDYKTSLAIPSDMGTHIYLNRRGRFLGGFLSNEEARQLAKRMRQTLLDARDSVDGAPIVRAVYLSEEVCTGEEVLEVPDLIVEYANRYSPSNAPRPVNPGLEGGHVPEGILLAWGPAIYHGRVPGTDLVHLTPTVLHLLGEPIPPDMDGQVVESLLEPAWQAQHPVCVSDQPAIVITETESGYTEDQLADVEAQLRALGYIE